MDLTHATYRRLLRHLGRAGRPVVCFRDLPFAGPFAILRHDVDFSLEQAVEMARMDADAGVTATFFLMVSSAYYSPYTAAGAAAAREIVALGHEIGLHYDPRDFDGDPDERARRRVADQAVMLADAAGAPVQVVAQHKPSRRARPLIPPGYLDAYDPRFFTEIGYMSDSRGYFREADPFGFAGAHDCLQLLIHPVWWSARGLDRREALERVEYEIRARARRDLTRELHDLGVAHDEEPATATLRLV